MIQFQKNKLFSGPSKRLTRDRGMMPNSSQRLCFPSTLHYRLTTQPHSSTQVVGDDLDVLLASANFHGSDLGMKIRIKPLPLGSMLQASFTPWS